MTHATSKRSRGFSLVELALVLLTVSILLTFAVPRFSLLTGRQLDSSAARMRALCAYLADEASLRGRVYRLEFSQAGDAWGVSMLTPWGEALGEEDDEIYEPEFEPHWDPIQQSGTFPYGVWVDRLDFAAARVEQSDSEIYFLPEGPAQNVTIELTNEDGDLRHVLVDSATGKVWIAAPDEVQP